jgi:hypothetical protein
LGNHNLAPDVDHLCHGEKVLEDHLTFEEVGVKIPTVLKLKRRFGGVVRAK